MNSLQNQKGLAHFTCEGRTYSYYDITSIPGSERLPVSLKILLENVMRCARDCASAENYAHQIVEAGLAGQAGGEIEFMPARVLFQDFTGVPVFVDLATMRDVAATHGADPSQINPQIPCSLVVDHSVIADVVSCPSAALTNAQLEAERNAERFSFLKWSAENFDHVEVVPPGEGICHQLNIERFCRVVRAGVHETDCSLLRFDTLVGTDSHTPTANGMGVLGWGVGGIEAEAAALGQPITMLVPAVIGVKLTGALPSGVGAMDLALTFAERLRARGVVGCMVECFGEGVASLSATQRATVANMSPEYGCTTTLFPADEATFSQLLVSGTDPHEVARARAYLCAQNITSNHDTVYAQVIEIDLGSIEPSLAGPSRPHRRVSISRLQDRFRSVLREHNRVPQKDSWHVELPEGLADISHGALAIAALTSCTTATDPAMMVAAGLVAQRAVALGCKPLPFVKKVFAPGSHSTTALLDAAGLSPALEELGFAVCGWGCMSCIGNSGPLAPELEALATQCEYASILSGNRNFDGRISPFVAQNYLASPALVVAYSLAGTVDINAASEPLCMGHAGPVYLQDLMPSDDEISLVMQSALSGEIFKRVSGPGEQFWRELAVSHEQTYPWDRDSTYVRRPPYFEQASDQTHLRIQQARCLALLGDFVTTDHISPAGSIDPRSCAAQYLRALGVKDADFNTYGSRRGNHEVMMRGCFGSPKLENALANGNSGAWSYNAATSSVEPLYECACAAQQQGSPLVVIAGKLYGSGSSRDWAAKAPALLGIRCVIAESYERIHRSNLVGMGIVPLQFKDGQNAQTLGLSGHELYDIEEIDFSAGLPASREVVVCAHSPSGEDISFTAIVRVDTPTEGRYLAAGGILPYVLQELMS